MTRPLLVFINFAQDQKAILVYINSETIRYIKLIILISSLNSHHKQIIVTIYTTECNFSEKKITLFKATKQQVSICTSIILYYC